MSVQFGWWSRDAEGRKCQIRVSIFGGAATWSRKQGHHQPWEPYGPPTAEDWDLLLTEAERRLPRRLLSRDQFEAIKRLRPV
ncbi:MAG TPA: hypothetical protein VLT83_02385 [Opitutaceae bacterium]|nr:hypothetical protein [Opitutaceae bacterium]